MIRLKVYTITAIMAFAAKLFIIATIAITTNIEKFKRCVNHHCITAIVAIIANMAIACITDIIIIRAIIVILVIITIVSYQANVT